MSYVDVVNMTKEEIKHKIKAYDTYIWRKGISGKKSLNIYEKYKKRNTTGYFL